MTTIQYQSLSLFISVLVVISMIILATNRKSARLFYLAMIMAWIPGIIYYISVLFFYREFFSTFGIPALDVSAFLRTYQYFAMGAWFIFDALELMFTKYMLRKRTNKLVKSIKNLRKEVEGKSNDIK